MDFKFLSLYKNISLDEMLDKLREETMEVYSEIAIPESTRETLASELLDVMQVCMGIGYVCGIDLKKYFDKHNEKLLSRGHEFFDKME